MLKINNISLPLSYQDADLKTAAAAALRLPPGAVRSARLSRRSVDARKKDKIHFVASLDVTLTSGEENYPDKIFHPKSYTPALVSGAGFHPVVAGSGPAGLFAAYVLALSGHEPIVLERGKPVKERMRDIEMFRAGGALNTESNIQFGEGGAGTFSDGKLNSGTKSPATSFILETFVKMGAPEDILWKSAPHIGTDYLRTVVENLRKEIIKLGGRFLFETKLESLDIKNECLSSIRAGGDILACDSLILAIGHSARDTFSMLYESGVPMTAKPFSVGMRIEHPREFIDRAMYGRSAGHPALGAADYKLAVHLPSGRGVYTFCMCPGGFVVAAASETGGVVTNGMSFHARNAETSNSALLTDVRPEDFGGDPLDGIAFQRKIEQAAFAVSKSYLAPTISVSEFMAKRAPTAQKTSYLPGTVPSAPERFLPEFVCSSLRGGLMQMNGKIRGFAEQGCLIGPETRSSSPVRMTRDERFESAVKGLYPCGEGAGYAGGIMSAAADGIRCAESAMKNFFEKNA